MPTRGLLLAAIVLAALSGWLYWSNKHPKDAAAKNPAGETAPKIIALNEADIRKIETKKKTGEDTAIERNESGKWRMTAPQTYAVDQDTAGQWASAVATITSDRVVEEKANGDSVLKQFGLDSPSMELDITKKDGKTQRVLVGDDVPGGNGAYVKLAGDSRVFTVPSYAKTGLDKSAKDLRDKRLLTFDQDKLSRVELVSVAKKADIEFGRSKDEWQILKPRPLRADGLQVEELLRKLKDAKMDVAVSDEDAKKASANFASGAPVATVKVTDPSGSQELQIRKKGDDYFAKSSAAEGVYKVSNDIGQGVDKSLDDFRNKKLFDFGFTEPNKIEIRDGAKSYAFQKSGEKWTSAGKEMDNTSVQSLVDKLRDLSAAKFVDAGFTAPLLEITVNSNDNKRVEKVLISKEGVAKRENEASLYQLDAKAVDELEKAASDVKPKPDVKSKK
jgi:hypothetical protein